MLIFSILFKRVFLSRLTQHYRVSNERLSCLTTAVQTKNATHWLHILILDVALSLPHRPDSSHPLALAPLVQTGPHQIVQVGVTSLSAVRDEVSVSLTMGSFPTGKLVTKNTRFRWCFPILPTGKFSFPTGEWESGKVGKLSGKVGKLSRKVKKLIS